MSTVVGRVGTELEEVADVDNAAVTVELLSEVADVSGPSSAVVELETGALVTMVELSNLLTIAL